MDRRAAPACTMQSRTWAKSPGAGTRGLPTGWAAPEGLLQGARRRVCDPCAADLRPRAAAVRREADGGRAAIRAPKAAMAARRPRLRAGGRGQWCAGEAAGDWTAGAAGGRRRRRRARLDMPVITGRRWRRQRSSGRAQDAGLSFPCRRRSLRHEPQPSRVLELEDLDAVVLDVRDGQAPIWSKGNVRDVSGRAAQFQLKGKRAVRIEHLDAVV